ncbi:hypothetical protein LO762_16450 [Actinocorallia sp. API 0066]|uniref:hypothetical protein n=1 Tax=Actinocorallia sp. API 0066 TaxID=2896846 RepID=UPI001E4756AA|nr:hypothetical protein [Actinocorallia sp. API 0066]MCD0450769.1 hypothetical protein [Actinocorallia sp. API 0066]
MIVFASNATGWDEQAQALIPGGMVDAYISPILAHLDPSAYRVERQPRPGAVNAYLSMRGRYRVRREIGKVGVMIDHGIADKDYRRGLKMSTFHYVTVPGPTVADRVVSGGVPRRKVVQVGYPKLDPLFNGDVPRVPRPAGGRIRVLWAPTHGGGSEAWQDGNRAAPGAGATSWWAREEVLSALDPDLFELTEAPHPRHRPDKRATLAEYASADVVIADGGSTIYEAWALGLPVVFPSWVTRDRNLERAGGATLEARIYRERIGYHADSPQHLADLVAQAAEEGQGERAVQFVAGVLPPEVRGRGGELHAEFLAGLDAAKWRGRG